MSTSHFKLQSVLHPDKVLQLLSAAASMQGAGPSMELDPAVMGAGSERLRSRASLGRQSHTSVGYHSSASRDSLGGWAAATGKQTAAISANPAGVLETGEAGQATPEDAAPAVTCYGDSSCMLT